MHPHILFVNDEAPISELLSLFFQKKGCEVTTASSGEQAKELLGQKFFDVAILDLNLPGEDGLELFRYFKEARPLLPVIIFTDMSVEEDLLKKALAGQAAGFMRKSESPSALFTEVCKHLPPGFVPLE